MQALWLLSPVRIPLRYPPVLFTGRRSFHGLPVTVTHGDFRWLLFLDHQIFAPCDEPLSWNSLPIMVNFVRR